MIDTIDAQDAWWPPTLSPDGFGRTRFASWMIAVDSHSTRRSISRNASSWSAAPSGVRSTSVPVMNSRPPQCTS
jgi:hypothetical protein